MNLHRQPLYKSIYIGKLIHSPYRLILFINFLPSSTHHLSPIHPKGNSCKINFDYIGFYFPSESSSCLRAIEFNDAKMENIQIFGQKPQMILRSTLIAFPAAEQCERVCCAKCKFLDDALENSQIEMSLQSAISISCTSVCRKHIFTFQFHKTCDMILWKLLCRSPQSPSVYTTHLHTHRHTQSIRCNSIIDK